MTSNPIPPGWQIAPIKHLASCNDSVLGEDTPTDATLSYIEIGNVQHGRGITGCEELTFGTAPSRARRLVQDGDVIVSTVRTYLRAIARIQQPVHNLVVSTGFAVLRPGPSLVSRFFGYAMQSEKLIDDIVAHSTGVSYPAISASDLIRLLLPFPDLEEQIVIADFLDCQTSKADALISNYERLIERLEEKRVALITQAVTKGLDLTVPMKDSGDERIGEIPGHWCKCRISYCLRSPLRNGLFVSGNRFGRGVPLVNVFDVYQNGGFINIKSLDCVDISTQEQQLAALENGDLLLVRSSLKDAGIGVVALYEVEPDECPVVFECHVIRIRLGEKCNSRYVFRLLQSAAYRSYFRNHANTTTMTTIGQDAVSAVPLLLPPMDEQKKIVTYVEEETRKITQARQKIEKAIEIVTERRAALITAAVTGQISVSTYTARQSHETVA